MQPASVRDFSTSSWAKETNAFFFSSSASVKKQLRRIIYLEFGYTFLSLHFTSAAHVAYGEIDGQPSHDRHGEEDHDHVPWVYTHRIGIDDVVAAAVAELHKTVLLLKKAEQKAHSYADDGTSEGY